MAIFTLVTTAAGLWAPRFTGTFTSDGTMTIVGDGTEFASSLVGKTFRIVGQVTDYTIASVTDATHLTTTGNVPAGSGQVAFLSSNQLGLIDANFHLLGSAALADDGDFQPYNANTTLLGNTTTGAGSIVLASSPTLTTPTVDSLTINALAVSGRENLLLASVSDDSVSKFGIGNGALTDGKFEPVFWGFTENSAIRAMVLRGITSTAGDNAAYLPLVVVQAAKTTSTSDPNNNVTSGIVNRPIFAVRNYTTDYLLVTAGGNIGIGTTTPKSPIDLTSAGNCRFDLYDSNGYGGRRRFSFWNGYFAGSENDLRIQTRADDGTYLAVLWTLKSLSGNMGVGTTTPNAKTEILSTTEQLRLSYDSTYYTKFLQSATGLSLSPSTDSTTALQFLKADGSTSVLTVDTANTRVGIGKTPGASFALDVAGVIRTDGSIYIGSTAAFGAYAVGTLGAHDFSINTANSAKVRIQNSTGNVGIGTLSPNAKVESLATVEQLRLSYSASVYTSFTADLNGDLTIAPSGGDTNVTGTLTASGSIKASQFKLSALNTAPASASATGTLGEICVTADYIYVCTATDTWKRAALASW